MADARERCPIPTVMILSVMNLINTIFHVTLFLPSTRFYGLLLVWLFLAGSADGASAFQRELFPSLGQSISCHLTVMTFLFDEDEIAVAAAGGNCGRA